MKKAVGFLRRARKKKRKKAKARKPAKKKVETKKARASRKTARKTASNKPTTKTQRGPSGKPSKKSVAKKKKPKNLATRAKAELRKNSKSQRKVARKLTAKQILFVDCYLGAAKRTATKAALMAGYSEKSVNSEASQLMSNPKVKSYLKRRQDDLRRRTEVTQEKIVKEMATLAFSKPTDFVRWENGALTITDSDEIPDSLVGAIKSIEPVVGKRGVVGLRVKFYDKVAAGKLLAQHLGMLQDKAGNDSRGIIVEAMERLHAQAAKAGKGNGDGPAGKAG